jgi:CCCH-type zinc finger
MTSKGLGLNAGAATFTPTVVGGGQPSPSSTAAGANTAPALPATDAGVIEDSFSEYAEMMDNIEDAMEDEADVGFATETPAAATDSHNTAPQTSLPPHLQRHAQEFWFPECRDCSCCNGFKHGCRCAASNGGECFCTKGGTPPFVGATVAAAGAAPGGGIHNHSVSGGRGRGGGGRGRVPCKFFFSQGGCRYGDNCTFSHQQ